MRRIPLVPTLVVVAALGVLLTLGVWQLERLKWKEALLARIAALEHAPARPLGPVLARAAAGANVAFSRVETVCEPSAAPSPTTYQYGLVGERIGWRVLTLCRIAAGGFDSILLDRGWADRSAGAMAPVAESFAAPGRVIGVLRPLGSRPWLGAETMNGPGGVAAIRVLDRDALAAIALASGARRPAPMFLAVEREDPAPASVTPSALPTDIPNNHLGYALTWFGLAAALVWVYIARLASRGV